MTNAHVQVAPPSRGRLPWRLRRYEIMPCVVLPCMIGSTNRILTSQKHVLATRLCSTVEVAGRTCGSATVSAVPAERSSTLNSRNAEGSTQESIRAISVRPSPSWSTSTDNESSINGRTSRSRSKSRSRSRSRSGSRSKGKDGDRGRSRSRSQSQSRSRRSRSRRFVCKSHHDIVIIDFVPHLHLCLKYLRMSSSAYEQCHVKYKY